MEKLRLVLYLCLIISVKIHSQEVYEDVLYLKNGSIIRGKILQNTSDTIKIESCRNLLVYLQNDILKVEQDLQVRDQGNATEKMPMKSKGFSNYTSIGLLTGKSEVTTESGFSFRSSIEYELNPYFGTGIGTGIEHYVYEIIPIYFRLKAKMANRVNSPYIAITFGYSLPLDSEKQENTLTYTYGGGLNAGFDVGICSIKNQFRAFTLSVGYQYQHCSENSTYTYWGGNSKETITYDFNKIAIKFGFMFM